jgi:uncharacterized Zn finger protein
MQAIAGEEWPKLRIALLDRLRQIARSHPDDAVDIFLHERSIDDAIAAIGGNGSDEATERVVEAAVETRPRWAIGTARQRAEAIMNASQSSRYHHAERWLLHAREAYRALGRLDEWNAYLQELLGKHRRKPRLRSILEALTE